MESIMVKMLRAPLVDHLEIEAEDLSLGSNCSVSSVTQEYFQFLYALPSCDIGVHVRARADQTSFALEPQSQA